MKKLIAIILCLAMILSLTACNFGKNDDILETQPTISQNDDVTQPPNNTEVPHDDECDDPYHNHEHEHEHVDTPDDKQAMWEQIFADGGLVINANSFDMTVADVMKTRILNDGENKYITISDNDDSMGVTLYKKGEDIYCKQYGIDEDGVMSCEWYVCEQPTEDDGVEVNVLDDAESSLIDIESFLALFDSIIEIEYIETVDGLDSLVLKCIDISADKDELEEKNENGEWVTTFDSTLEVEYNGVVGQFRYDIQSDGDGGSSWSSYWVSDEEPIESMLDWDFNPESLTLTNGDEVLQCALIENHMIEVEEENKNADEEVDGDVAPDLQQIVDVYIKVNPATYELKTISFEMNGEIGSIEFINCDDVPELVDMPDDIEKTIPAEDAAISFAMMIFAIAMGAAE